MQINFIENVFEIQNFPNYNTLLEYCMKPQYFKYIFSILQLRKIFSYQFCAINNNIFLADCRKVEQKNKIQPEIFGNINKSSLDKHSSLENLSYISTLRLIFFSQRERKIKIFKIFRHLNNNPSIYAFTFLEDEIFEKSILRRGSSSENWLRSTF